VWADTVTSRPDLSLCVIRSANASADRDIIIKPNLKKSNIPVGTLQNSGIRKSFFESGIDVIQDRR
jgi:hypothetical protein